MGRRVRAVDELKMTELIKSVDKPITMRHEKWLSSNSNPNYSQRALEFAAKALKGEIGGNRERKSLFRASSAGSCQRKQVFSAAGVKGNHVIDSDLANIFATGNFLHLKWQMAGLTEGWLAVAELAVESKEYNFGGTLDGVIDDGSLFEFKSINPRGFAQVCEWGPRHDHLLQAHGYMWLANLPAVSFIYEDKGSGEWREFRIHRDELIVDAVIGMVDDMENHLAEKTLPAPLPDCVKKTGYVYRHCPFKETCLSEDF